MAQSICNPQAQWLVIVVQRTRFKRPRVCHWRNRVIAINESPLSMWIIWISFVVVFILIIVVAMCTIIARHSMEEHWLGWLMRPSTGKTKDQEIAELRQQLEEMKQTIAAKD